MPWLTVWKVSKAECTSKNAACELVNDSLISQIVKNSNLDEAVLDNLVREILTVVLKPKHWKNDVDQNIAAHHQLARQVAAEAATYEK